MAKRVKRKTPVTPDIAVCECPMFIYFSREVKAERAMMRRMAHRAIDLVVDGGGHYLLGLEVALSLSILARHRAFKEVRHLVHEVWSADKKVDSST